MNELFNKHASLYWFTISSEMSRYGVCSVSCLAPRAASAPSYATLSTPRSELGIPHTFFTQPVLHDLFRSCLVLGESLSCRRFDLGVITHIVS